MKFGIKSVNAARQNFAKAAVTVNTAKPVDTAHPKRTMNAAKPRRNIVPKAVLMKFGIKSVNAARQNFAKAAVTVNTAKPVDTAHPKGTMNAAKPRNKLDERGIIIRNNARLVAQGHTQEEGIDYDEVFAPVARIEAIRLFLAYASFNDFVVYQIDVKSAFHYEKIEEEVYVWQPLGFEDPDFPDKVYKVEKALYGLHQATRAWYETLSTYLLDNGFQRGMIDKTLFIKRDKSDILLVQVYVNDIIFGSTRKEICIEFEKMMHKKFQMSSMGELTFFLVLQVKQKEYGIFISQDKLKIGFQNKLDKRGIVIRNKARLVAQGHTQEEGIDYDEVFAPVARIEAIRLFLAYASFNDFVVYQIDVKSAFHYEKIEEEVYVWQPLGFEDPDFPD
nr:putative ribonuclease H-like domain-containing protein [Tanacetum cinerariifolium]